MGLPFDAVSESDAERIVRDSAAGAKRCFISTPNLNFAVACRSDPDFRYSVLRSDLSIADGMPILALARLVKAPLPERVAGSSLFERLMRGSPANPVKVFFFGGEDGVAARAAQVLASGSTGVTCVGYHSPGFGTLEDMSHPAIIEQMNASGAQFLLVAIGARKGQAWLLKNLDRLHTPVLAYLGAVINFVAGTVKRAPRWLQRLHLEWLWRIVQEPALSRRYWSDGVTLLRVLFTEALPAAVLLRMKEPSPKALGLARLVVTRLPEGQVLRLEGAWTHRNLDPLRAALASFGDDTAGTLGVDLSSTTYIDMAAVGLLQLARGAYGSQVTQASPIARRILTWGGAGYLLSARQGTNSTIPPN
jgi:N-acetylglucosaminyldiphosphoundecaprenol N-acetyl-beta-D-mannosaminyltransferase